MGKRALLLYPNQLFNVEHLPKDIDQIILIEEPLLFGSDQQYKMFMHKQKLVFLRASMRRYIEEQLWPAGYQVDYIEFHQMNESGDVVNMLRDFETVLFFDLSDDVLHRRVTAAIEGLDTAPQIEVLPSPNFFLTREELKNFFADKDKSTFINFYQWQRERFNILIDQKTYKPIGGHLSFESEVRKRLPKDQVLPSFQVYGSNKFVTEAKEYINHHFAENPGSFDDFPWPTNHQEALDWLKVFLESRLDDFGVYEDAIDGSAPWVYHSGLSPLLNSGLLQPKEVVLFALERHAHSPVPIESLESFIRQVIGWREYTRGIYIKQHVQARTSNSFGHNRLLTEDWYKGTTGIKPVDDVIHKVLTRGYAHQVERLMIVGNIMLLCDFHPTEVYRWFSEMFVDSYDWVVVPNVYVMSQFADGGSLINKPYISTSNYILKMSHYEQEDWCDVWDGLYWRFIEKNKDRFEKNPNMKKTVATLEKMSENRKRVISYRAEDFLKSKTAL